MTPNELKKWREKNGFSQHQLARALGIFIVSSRESSNQLNLNGYFNQKSC